MIYDKPRLNQVLNHLIYNALKFTDSGSITLSTQLISETKEFVTISFSVIDTGRGISDQHLKSIFDPYHQFKAGEFTGEYDEKGLGLSISSRLVKLMGGELIIKTQEGGGSMLYFTLDLPIDHNYNPNKVEAEFEINQYISSLRVLVVDDVSMNRKVATLMLKKLGCDTVDEAENGQIAVEMSKSVYYDIILMDISMPVMKGDEATKIIKSRKEPRPVVIGLSAEAMEGDREKYISLGMDDYMMKPVKLKYFHETLNAHVKSIIKNRGEIITNSKQKTV